MSLLLNSLRELYRTPWGPAEAKRKEIEDAGYGQWRRILMEEITNSFFSITRVGVAMDAHPSTALRWMKSHPTDVRYIIFDNKNLYHKDDIYEVIERRKQTKATHKKRIAA